jgi:hypothetical protein
MKEVCFSRGLAPPAWAPAPAGRLKDWEAQVDRKLTREYLPTAVADDAVMREHYRQYAQRIWPDGAMLICPRCGRAEEASIATLAQCLARGWPKCCRIERMQIGDRSDVETLRLSALA